MMSRNYCINSYKSQKTRIGFAENTPKKNKKAMYLKKLLFDSWIYLLLLRKWHNHKNLQDNEHTANEKTGTSEKKSIFLFSVC